MERSAGLRDFSVGFLMVFAMSVHMAFAAGPTTHPAETLQNLVHEHIELQLELQAEIGGWKEEKAHLETTSDLLSKELAQLKELLDAAEGDIDSASTDQASSSSRAVQSENILDSLDQAIEEYARELLEVYATLPSPLATMIGGGATRVRPIAWSRNGMSPAPERLQVATTFGADLQRLLGSIHRVQQVLELEDDLRIEADVLYIGGAIGYYVSPDGKLAGMIVREHEDWVVLPHNDLADVIRTGFAVFSKQRPPELVSLPLGLMRRQDPEGGGH